MLTISGKFDSANPHQDGIIKRDKNSFVLHSFSETSVEAFKFDTSISNSSFEKQRINLEIIWPTKPFSELRDCFYWQHKQYADLTVVPATTKPGHSSLSFEVAPGTGILSLHPHYGYNDCEKFIDNLNHQALKKSIAGKSEQERNIWLLKVANLIKLKPEKKFLVSARNHANESSGSYCVEGMLQWLLSDDPLAKYALSRHEFYFIPMSNPDGVADGMARHTSREYCADLNKTLQWHEGNAADALHDKSLNIYYEMLNTIQPTHFMNMHSYLFKFQDELYSLLQSDADRFFKFMPDQLEFNKVWKTKIHTHKNFPTGYCHEKYGTLPLLVEIPWFGRNAATMRLTGKRLLKAFIMMNTINSSTNWGDI
jgi:zinc carboxypeptidase